MRARLIATLCMFLQDFCCGQSRGRLIPKGFSIAKVLLTVLLIVFICLVMLWTIPRRHPPGISIRQKAQLKSIDTALELFNAEFGYYPPSDALDEDGRPYCGAMKLCEAVMGQDLMGVHPNLAFRSDGTDGKEMVLYPDPNDLSEETYKNNLGVRKGPYFPVEVANAHRLKDLYKNVGPFDGDNFVLCDTWRNVRHSGTGKRIGMPTLYYKADTSKAAHDTDDPNNPENIYNYKDNHALVGLGVPGRPGQTHPLYENPKIFYEMTKDYRDITQTKPNNAETFVLLSAGKDGLYGTEDDIANFEIGWIPK